MHESEFFYEGCLNKLHAFDVISIGIAAVDDLKYVAQYPEPDVKVPVLARARQGGGPACTAAAAVGSLGGRSVYLARLAHDELSSFIRAALTRKGVDVEHLVYDGDAGPYHSIVVVDENGRRTVFYDASRYTPLPADDVSEQLLTSAGVVLLDHITDPSLLSVAMKAKALGVPIVGDIEGMTDSAHELCRIVDYLVVSRQFACWASGSANPEEACGRLAAQQRKATVVTVGEQGCYFAEGAAGNVAHLPAFRVSSYDTNGCGDTFHGAFALGVARGLSVSDTITFSAACAALKAFACGGARKGWDAIPSLEEVKQFVRAQGPGSALASLLDRLDRWPAAAPDRAPSALLEK